MRRVLWLAVLLLPMGCALMAPSGQRFVVFFQTGGFALEDEAIPVVDKAAAYAADHPDRKVVVAGFADPSGTAAGSDSVSELRARNVVRRLVADGVAAARITRRGFGATPYSFDSQEGRRVEITIGDM